MLNKKRLAALGLSAVMVASTASLPVSAADFSDGGIATQSDVAADETEDFGVETANVEVNDDAQDAVGATVTKVEWNNTEGKETMTYTVEGMEPVTVKAHRVITEENKATCFKEGKYYLQADELINGENAYRTSDPYILSKLTGHKWEHKKEVVGGTCDESNPQPGNVVEWDYCLTCKAESEHKSTGTQAIKHSIPSYTTTYKCGVNTVQPDGKTTTKPELEDTTKPGYYTEIQTGFCNICHKTASIEIPRTIVAEGYEVTSKVVSNFDNIDEDESDFREGEDYKGKELPANNEIVLKECDKEGSYDVTTIYSNGEETKTVKDTVKIDPQHVAGEVVIVPVDEKDEGYLKPVFVDGKLVDVVNSTCTRDIKYKVVTYCKQTDVKGKDSAGKEDPKGHIISTSEEKIAPRSTTNHVENKVQTYVQSVKDAKGSLTADYVNGLADNKYVKVIPDAVTCTEDGTVGFEFYCEGCGKTIGTISGVKSEKLGHAWAYSIENKEDATCEKAGSYDLVGKCTRCGKVDTIHTINKKLPHTNQDANGNNITTSDNKESEIVVKFVGNRVVSDKTFKVGDEFNQNYIGSNAEGKGRVSTEVYTNCATCHNNLVQLNNVTNLKITVTSVKLPTYNASNTTVVTPGTLGLKASYTRKSDGKTVVTADTSVMYVNSLTAKIPDEFKSGLEKDADGVYRYYVNGEFDSTFVGIADYNGERFFVTNGIMDNKASGLNSYDGKWYYLSEGRITKEHTGLVQFDGQWFYVANGVMDAEKSGLVEYNGGTFLFINGRKAAEVNGLWLDSTTGIWYFLADGQVQTQHKGVAMYDGEFFYIENGKLAKDFKGTVTYDGKKFNVVDGQLYGPIK